MTASESEDRQPVVPPAGRTAHVDTFTRDNLPPREDWPVFDFTLPDGSALAYPAQLNCATALLDHTAAGVGGGRPALRFAGRTWSYRDLSAQANRIAHVLVDDLGVVPGNRVLLRGPNNPTLVACWFAVLKVGAVAVTTMPLLRTRELAYTLTKARVAVALCDARFVDELHAAAVQVRDGGDGLDPRVVVYGDNEALGSLESLAVEKPTTYANVETASDDVALIAFTSGTTGQAKGTMHFHRDVLAVCDCFAAHLLGAGPDDVFCGTPPLGFTFALGALVLFPFRAGRPPC